MEQYLLTGIFIYPIKSLGGIEVETAEVERRGLQYDRRWMLVDETNQFMTQRSIPEMALLQVGINSGGLHVTHRQNTISDLQIPFGHESDATEMVKIWESKCSAFEVGKEYSQWFSEALGKPCKLVYMPDSTERQVNPERASGQIVSFADGYPFLVIGQKSLDDLNNRLVEPVPMNRFRPNLVFSGGFPYEEDNWQRFKVGNVPFLGVKKCGRCKITTVDQMTAVVGREPIQTMKTYRTENSIVNFGMNAVTLSPGTIKVGDTIELS